MQEQFDPTTLLGRIDKLERSAARQRGISLAMGALVALFAFGGASSSGPIRITASDGTSTYISGGLIKFYDSQDRVRSYVGLSTDGSANITVYDTAGTKRMIAGEGTSGGPLLEVNDSSGTLRAYMGQYASGGYGMYSNDSSGTTTWQTPK